MDFDLRQLEFPQIVEMTSDFAQTELGKREVRNFSPIAKKESILKDLDLIDETIHLLPHLPGLIVPEFWFDRTQYSHEELFRILRFLDLCSGLVELPLKKGGALEDLIRGIDPLSDLKAYLSKVFDEHGSIRNNASPRLSNLRRELIEVHNRIISSLGKIIRKNQRLVNSDRVTSRKGRFVICIKKEGRKMIRGVVHDISESGHSLFIEPEETISDQNYFEELKIDEEREIGRIIRDCSKMVVRFGDRLELNQNIAVRLDTILARAWFAIKTDSVRPRLNDVGRIRIRSGRHPILQQVKGEGIVPLDLELKSGILIVTGPNAGGKTVLLKTVGLFTAMANAGFYIPADEGTDLPIVDRIFAKIVDDQSLTYDLSSFGFQIETVKRILNTATKMSLVLLDELGSNTSPREGSALAGAILEKIKEIGARCICTTHSEDLKVFAYGREGFQIGAMTYNGRPTYRFQPNYFAPSCAFKIAEQMGLGPDIISRARELLGDEKGQLEELTGRLADAINLAEGDTRNAELRLNEAKRLKEKYQQKLAEIENWKRVKRQEFKRRLDRILKEARSEVERLIAKLSSEGPKKELIKEVRNRIDRLKIEEKRIAPDIPIGSLVRLAQETGRVRDRRKDQYLVEMGRIRLWIHGSALDLIEAEPTPTLNLRGRRRDEVGI
ncbi:MAG TPA: hypothetical protein EYP24_04190, partial [bacterium (Candidatus Stahlbacteria)]|nr:hypothetical protein [Candidatus Stahlbacteria bacterium]